MKRVYNTGRVRIGLAYEPPRRVEMSLDAERLQLALLRRPNRSRARHAVLAVSTLAAFAAVSLLFIK
jgi:hypothetical protein